MKTYRTHRCGARHRTARTFMECAIPRAEWVLGRGEYAVIAWCEVPTVTLHETPEEATRSRETIDNTACGGRCSGLHEVVRVVV